MLGSAQNCHRPNVASFNGALTAAAVASRWKVNHGGTVGFYLGISWDVSFFSAFHPICTHFLRRQSGKAINT